MEILNGCSINFVKIWVRMDLIWEQPWVVNIDGKRDDHSTGR